MYVNSCQEGITANKCFKNSYKFSLEYRFFLTWHLIHQINEMTCSVVHVFILMLTKSLLVLVNVRQPQLRIQYNEMPKSWN